MLYDLFVNATLQAEPTGLSRSIEAGNVFCSMYTAPPHLCSALVTSVPEWKFSPTDVSVRLVHNNTVIPLSRKQHAVLDPVLTVKFIPIVVSLIPSIIQLRGVTSEIRINGFGFTDCVTETVAYGWTLWLQALSQDVPPNMMESHCRVLDVESLLCIMPDWGAHYPAATVRVNVLDCSRQDVQQILPEAFTISLLPSVQYLFPTMSSFRNAVPVTIIGKGLSSDLGLKIIFDSEFDLRSVVVNVVNHTMIIAETPNWGSLISQQNTNVSVFTDKDELLGGWWQTPSFLFTHSIRRVFPSVHSSAGGSTVTVYGLGFVPGKGYTCTFVAANDSTHVMSHSLGTAPGFTVIKCMVPAWGAQFRAGRVFLLVTVPAQSQPISADSGSVIALSFQPAIYSVYPVVVQFSRTAVAVVNGTGFGANMSLIMRLKSDTDTIIAVDACTIFSFTNMTCPIPAWSVLFPAQTVQVFFDVVAADISMIYIPPNTQIQFLASIQNLHPTSGEIRGGTLILFTCEGLFKDRRIVVKFTDFIGNEKFSIPEFSSNSSSFAVASPNWMFSYPSSSTFTASVSVRPPMHSRSKSSLVQKLTHAH